MTALTKGQCIFLLWLKGWFITTLFLLTGCISPRVDVQKICPKYPNLSTFTKECYSKLKKFEGFICKHTDGKYYVCYDEKNNNAIGDNFDVLFTCIDVLNEQIKFYNNVILNGKK